MNRRLEKYRLIKVLKQPISESYWVNWRQAEYIEWLREKLRIPEYKGIQINGYNGYFTYEIRE